MATRQEVYRAIDGERDYQDLKWSGHQHEVGAYLTMLRNYVTKAEYAWTDNSGDTAALDVIRKIAGIAVHCMEQNGVVHRGVSASSPQRNLIDSAHQQILSNVQ